MYLVIQFPLLDARKFISDAPPSIVKPNWNLPKANSDFIRYFGGLTTRTRGGIRDKTWGADNERIVCMANHVLAFHKGLNPKTSPPITLRKSYVSLYFDGYSRGKFEVGITSSRQAHGIFTPEQ